MKSPASNVELVDHGHPMAERFILAIGPICEQLGIDPPNGEIWIWDQQEKKRVAVIDAEYSQAICLERRDDVGGMSALCSWFNQLSPDCMASENIVPSKVATLQQVFEELVKLGVIGSMEYQFINIDLGGGLSACVGQANETWNGEVVNMAGEAQDQFYLETGISVYAINAQDIAKGIDEAAKELSHKIANSPKHSEVE